MGDEARWEAVVTTPDRGGPEDLAAAEAMAARLGVPRVRRRGLARLARDHGVPYVLVAGADGCALYAPPSPTPLRFHGSLGVVRARALAGGGRDALVEAGGVRPGDRVVDATAGLCADALVLAWAVGEAGSVTALEGSRLLHAVMACGLARAGGDPILEAARARLDLVHAEHLAWLGAQPDRSFDVVVFDPMFRTAGRAPRDFELLRALADPRPLADEAVTEAVRVARRRVVLVDDPEGTELARLGFEALPAGRGTRRRYGVLRVEG